MFEKKKLPMFVAAAIFSVAGATPLYAQEAADVAKDKACEALATAEEREACEVEIVGEDIESIDEDIENIVVTGSLIPRSSYDGPSPMTVIGEEEMKEKGLLTIADVIDSLSENTGYSEGDGGNLLSGFTVGAREANMRGLGVGRTLVLVNGRRVADYPLPFGGEQNGVDLGTIPSAAMARVEYLNSGASAIYGSDAVGGVINIITKRDMEQTWLSTTQGVYQEGYGHVSQTSFVTGEAFEKGGITFGLEHLSSDSINADEVSFMDDRRFRTNAINALVQDSSDMSGFRPISPDGFDCSANGMENSPNTQNDGERTCISDFSDQIAMSPSYDRLSVFADGRYEFNDSMRGFATLMATRQEVENYNPSFNWNGFILSDDQTAGMQVQRSFGQDFGPAKANTDQLMWSLSLGLEGEVDLAGNTWNWDIGVNHADFSLTQKYDALKEEVVRDWIFDGHNGAVNTLAPNVYQIDSGFFASDLVDNVFRSARGDRADLVGRSTTDASSSADSVSFKVVGELSDFGFLYNPASMAVIADWSNSKTSIDPDARSLDNTGNGWLSIGAIEASGDRSRSAVGAEFRLPVLEDLELTIASRFDRYDDSTAIGGRNTSQVKFTYTPFDAVMFRGGVSQSFRAPDMFNIYGESTGFTVVSDLVNGNCWDGETFSGGCPSYQVESTRRGRDDLEEEKGKDYSFGVVFSPFDGVNLSADWWKVRLEDLVLSGSSFDLMNGEWQCETGVRDSNSAFCQDVANRVIRDATGRVSSVIIEPQNSEFRELEGFDLRANLSWQHEQLGQFGAGLNYTNTLSHEWQVFAGDEVFDLRGGQPGQSLPVTNTNLNVGWSNALTGFKTVGANLFVQRAGRMENFAQTKDLEPFYTANFTAFYRHDARTQVQLAVRNLTDAKPQTDATNPRWPYYWQHQQAGAAFGRNISLTVSYMLR